MKAIASVALFALFNVFTVKVQAAQNGPWASCLNIGVNNFVDGTNASQGQIGGALSYAFIPEVSVGVQFATGGNFTQTAAEVIYNFASGVFVGVQGGPVNYNASSGWGYGPQAGYDYDIGNGFAVGPEFQYQVLSLTSGTTAGQNSAPTLITSMLNLTYMF